MDIHTLYAVNIATVEAVDLFIDQIQDFSIDPAIEPLLIAADGDVDPTFVAVGSQEPSISFTTTALATALGGAGISGLKITSDADDDGAEFWFRKASEGGVRATGANHIKMTVNEGLLIPVSLSASEESATLEYRLITSYDSTNDPVVIETSQSIEGTAAVSEVFVNGPVNINGANLPGVKEITVDFGIEPFIIRADGDVWPTFVAIKNRRPVITIRCYDVAALNTFGLTGTAQGPTDSEIYLKKVSEGSTRVSDVTEQHIKLSIDDGHIRINSAGGGGDDPQEAEVIIVPTYDGTNAIIAIDTSAAIT